MVQTNLTENLMINLLHVNTSSNYPPQIIRHLPTSTANILSKNLSNIEILNSVKVEYEISLENNGYHVIKLSYTKRRRNKSKYNRGQKIIWFNPPYSQNVITNVAKRFMNLLDHHFSKSSKLHKMFNRNTVKVSYSCRENISCNFRTTSTCPLNGQCQSQEIIYKCTTATSVKCSR